MTLEGYSATSPGLFATIAPVTFGSIAVGNTTSQSITLTNNGGTDITLGTISNVSLQLSPPMQLALATTCATAQILKPTQGCLLVISFTATPVGVYTQTLKLTYHDGGLDHILSVKISGTAWHPIASNIAPAAFNEDLESNAITLSYNQSGGLNATTCALTALSNVVVTQACACSGSGICTVKVKGTANYFGAASFGFSVTAGGLVSNTATATLNISSVNDAPVLTVPSNRRYPLDGADEPIIQGTQYTFTSSTTDVESNPISYTCTYATPNLAATDMHYAAAGTPCTSLPSLVTVGGVLQTGTATFSTTTSALVWQPTNRQKGVYEITITATDSNAGADTEVFSLTVRESFTTTNLLAAFDATYSDLPSIPRLDGGANDDATAWIDLTLNNITASLAGFTTPTPWAGVGTYSNPYQLTLNGTNDAMSVDAVLGNNTKMMFNTWINPASASLKDKIILGNGGGSGNGFVLQQSQTVAGKIELAIGNKRYSDLILADSPVGYWRLTETVGTTATDSSLSVHDGTYVNGPTLGQAGPLASSGTASAYFDGLQGALGQSVKYVTVTNTAALAPTGQVSVEAWVKKTIGTDATYLRKNGDYLIDSEGASAIRFTVNSNWAGANGAFPDNGLWHHIVGTYDGSNLKVYVDGILKQTAAYTGAITTSGGALHLGARDDLWITNLNGNMAEAAVYNYALSPGQISAHYDAGVGIFYPNNILAWRPSAFWRFDEKAGNSLIDLSPNANHGTYAGTYTLNAAGALANDTNSATLFQSAGVTIPDHASLSSATKLSLAFWFKPNSIPVGFGETLITKWGGGGGATVNYVLYYYGDTSGGDGWLRLHANAGGAYTEITSYVIPPLNTWTHIAMTYDSTGNGIIYVNGTQVNSIAAPGILATNNGQVSINKSNGSLDELAIFNYVLTAKQVAQIYSSGSFSKCQTETTFTNGAWKFLSGLWDGTALSLFVNGREECKITPTGVTFTPGTSPNTYVGASPNATKNWAGSLADLKIYGASGAGSPGTASAIKNDFNVTANQFRAEPVPEIVSNGLVLDLDAANAKQGLAPYPSGCSTSDLVWSDLSTNMQFGNLRKFSACGPTSGWNGAGIPTNPYRLNFDGASGQNDVVAFSLHSDHRQTVQVTLEAWFNLTNVAPTQIALDVSGWYRMAISAGKISIDYNIGGNIIGSNIQLSTANLNPNTWYHAVWTYDGANSVIYLNGAMDNSRAQAGGIWGQWGPAPLTVGGYDALGIYALAGSLTAARMYNRALTPAEVSQNCRAFRSRFSGATCAP
ncbi:MAG: hypothetical protein A2X86_01780 [Bdellovibrionales bacterium GWA2_49_15]|nr:MAG: hypothetical protein A2X86_01780 [Bdellovibrionales bacterium GWA2_49_15]